MKNKDYQEQVKKRSRMVILINKMTISCLFLYRNQWDYSFLEPAGTSCMENVRGEGSLCLVLVIQSMVMENIPTPYITSMIILVFSSVYSQNAVEL